MNKSIFTIFFLLSIVVKAQFIVSKSILEQIESIDSNKIKDHVTYLADDQLMGRLPGKPGFQMAADYVINQFKSFGLKPAGENNTFLQKVILRNSKVLNNNASVKIILANGSTKELLVGENVVIFPNHNSKLIDINAQLVFVGAGFDAPKFGLDDYKNIDVKGKIVVIMKRIPENVSENVKRHLTYSDTYQAVAQKKGAIGILICDYAQSATRFKGLANYVVATGTDEAIGPNGKVVGINKNFKVYGNISIAAIKEIMQNESGNFDSTWKQIERGQFVSRPMKSTINIHYENNFNDIVSYNVIGKIVGSDPKLNKEYVIHSGHLDHIGISKPINGDSINNGAHDNASGIACSLEIARMYGNLKVKPKRSILFVFCTAEEMGLLGSAYFANYPTIPINKLVADVNMDMPTIIAPLESVAPLGAEHSSIWAVVEQAATSLNLKIETDPDPSEGRFVRSDQYNFHKAGIPALHIKYGYKFSDPNLHLFDKVKLFRANNYHKPSDNLNDSFVWSAGRKYAQVNFLVSYLIAQNSARPTWVKGDFFNPEMK